MIHLNIKLTILLHYFVVTDNYRILKFIDIKYELK